MDAGITSSRPLAQTVRIMKCRMSFMRNRLDLSCCSTSVKVELPRTPLPRTRVNRDRRTGLAMVRAMQVVAEPKARPEVLCRALELQEGGGKPCTQRVDCTLLGIRLRCLRSFVPTSEDSVQAKSAEFF